MFYNDFDIFDNLSYYAKQFRFSEKAFRDMRKGLYGEDKQVFALIILNWDRSFVNNIINNQHLKKLDQIEYFNESLAEDKFGFRPGTFLNWGSPQRKNLVKCILHTPVCFEAHYRAYIQTNKSLKALMPAISIKP